MLSGSQSRFLSIRRFSPLKSRHYFFSTTPSLPSQSRLNVHSRLQRINNRLPSFLRRHTTPLLGAPVIHITSFLILHEITAIVPLLGLVTAFHYGNWMPDLTEGEGSAFDEGQRRFGRWLKKKGWVDDEVVDVAASPGPAVGRGEAKGQTITGTPRIERKGVRLILEFATAYAIMKALLPARIAMSVWATPWFARTVVQPVGRRVGQAFKSRG